MNIRARNYLDIAQIFLFLQINDICFLYDTLKIVTLIYN